MGASFRLWAEEPWQRERERERAKGNKQHNATQRNAMQCSAVQGSLLTSLEPTMIHSTKRHHRFDTYHGTAWHGWHGWQGMYTMVCGESWRQNATCSFGLCGASAFAFFSSQPATTRPQNSKPSRKRTYSTCMHACTHAYFSSCPVRPPFLSLQQLQLG